MTALISAIRSCRSSIIQRFQLSGNPCTTTTSTMSRAPYISIRRMKNSSIGEMPPGTRVIFAFSAQTASTRKAHHLRKISHFRSILKSQCDLLFGSFHTITASIIGSVYSAHISSLNFSASIQPFRTPASALILIPIKYIFRSNKPLPISMRPYSIRSC